MEQLYQNGKPVVIVPKEEYDALMEFSESVFSLIDGFIAGYIEKED